MAPLPPKRLTATILETLRLSDEISWFRLGLSQPIGFSPGQYVSLRFPGELRFHAFSIASSPAKRQELELVVKKEREFTTRMLSSPPGTVFELLGPMGKFMENPEGDVVMIAGGVGVTPFLSAVRAARDGEDRRRQWWLFYSCRTRQDIVAEEELRKLHDLNDHVHVVFTLTRETPSGWDGELGHVDKAMLERHLGRLDGKTFYTCGPGRLIDAMAAMLKEAGVPSERILTESWG